MKYQWLAEVEELRILEEALTALPHEGIEGLATLSRREGGPVIELGVNLNYHLESVLPEDCRVIKRESESILFEAGGHKYLAFHQR